ADSVHFGVPEESSRARALAANGDAPPVLPMDLVMKVESALRAAGVERSLSAQAQGELEALREAYTADLPQQLAGIALAVHQLRVAPSSAALRGVVRRCAHRVAGTAGSFGYDDIGDACARTEQVVLSLAHVGGPGPR